MADSESLSERVSTVERAVTDGDHDLPDADDLAELEARLTATEDRVEELADRTRELEAATQALRGYVGSIRSVNEDVEERADAAVAAVERLESRLNAESGASTDTWKQRDRTDRPDPDRSESTREHPRSGRDEPTRQPHRRERIEPPTTVGGEPDERTDSAGRPGLLARVRSLL